MISKSDIEEVGELLRTSFGKVETPEMSQDLETRLSIIVKDFKDYVDVRDQHVETRVKYWVVAATLAQIVALIPIIFFLGGIYNNANASLDILKNQQAELVRRGNWMVDRQIWEDRVEQWAVPKGLHPPRSSNGGQ